MNRRVWTTTMDMERLQGYLREMSERPDARELPYIVELAAALEKAKVVGNAETAPPDIITMRSKVRLSNLDTGTDLECTLVYPPEANANDQRISVLAPLGTAMLGRRVGDEFVAKLPKGNTRFRVEEILYQPESAGDYHL